MGTGHILNFEFKQTVASDEFQEKPYSYHFYCPLYLAMMSVG